MSLLPIFFVLFFFNDTATTEIYTLSLHDALPICILMQHGSKLEKVRNLSLALAFLRGETEYYASCRGLRGPASSAAAKDRKSTRLNSSHGYISYAVFCLKKKKKQPL